MDPVHRSFSTVEVNVWGKEEGREDQEGTDNWTLDKEAATNGRNSGVIKLVHLFTCLRINVCKSHNFMHKFL